MLTLSRIAVAALFLLVPATAGTSIAKSGNLRRRADKTSLLCRILEVHELTGEGETDHLECDLILAQEGAVRPGLQIVLPDDIVKHNLETLRRGDWFVSITGASVKETKIEGYGTLPTSVSLSESSTITTVPADDGRLFLQTAQGSISRNLNDRQLVSRKTVTRTLLVVRISTPDATPSYTVAQLNQYFFSPTTYSVARQYNLCSSSWIKFKRAIPNAVIDVLVPASVFSFTKESLWSGADVIASAQKNVTSLDTLSQHVAYILPSGTMGGVWYATGTVGAGRTIFNNTFAMPNTVMHELGHNLGLGHAGLGTDAYGDTSDLMGYGDYSLFGPSKCFNGYHYWALNWFTDRRIEIDPFTPKTFKLASFTDYNSTTALQYVVAKVDVYYMVYNKVKGVNAGVTFAPNQVTVVQSTGGQSWFQTGLNATTAPFQVANFGGGTQPLVIRVCSTGVLGKVAFAVVSVGIGAANCP